MKDFIITTDITCDVNEKLQKEFNVEVINGHFTTPDKTERPSVLEWKEFDREEFYNALKKDPNGFTTSPPNIDECAAAFGKHAAQGEGVIAICISQALSGTYGFMLKAKEQTLAAYPDAKIEIIDSMRFGPAAGLMAVYCSELKKAGLSFEEVVENVEKNKNRFHQAGWLDDLSFVAKKGRISHAKAFFGTLVGVKPIGEFDKFGMTTVIGKAKGEKNAYDALIKYIEKTVENPSEQIFFVATSNRHRQAEIFTEMIKEKFRPKAIYLNDVFPNCGINVGPGLMAAYYMGKPISDDLAEEKKLLAEIIG